MKDLRSELTRIGYVETKLDPREEAVQKWQPELRPLIREILELGERTGMKPADFPLEWLVIGFPMTSTENKLASLARMRDKMRERAAQ